MLYRIITEYFKNLYSKILEMDKFLDLWVAKIEPRGYKVPK
jgi:hypothetical protein